MSGIHATIQRAIPALLACAENLEKLQMISNDLLSTRFLRYKLLHTEHGFGDSWGLAWGSLETGAGVV